MDTDIKEFIETAAAVAGLLSFLAGAVMFAIRWVRRKNSRPQKDVSSEEVVTKSHQSQSASGRAVAIQAGGNVSVGGGGGAQNVRPENDEE